MTQPYPHLDLTYAADRDLPAGILQALEDRAMLDIKLHLAKHPFMRSFLMVLFKDDDEAKIREWNSHFAHTVEELLEENPQYAEIFKLVDNCRMLVILAE
eukprot:763744-Hanusia_phi.AAC.6